MTGEFALALHAILYLHHAQKTCSSESLAKNICTNSARIRKVLSILHKSGIIETKEGMDGGYSFTKRADEITLADIQNALHIQIVKGSWRSGDRNADCPIASAMPDAMDALYALLNNACTNCLENITLQDFEGKLLQKEK